MTEVILKRYDDTECEGEVLSEGTVQDDSDLIDCESAGCPIVEIRSYTAEPDGDGSCTKGDDFVDTAYAINVCIDTALINTKFVCTETTIEQNFYDWLEDDECAEEPTSTITWFEEGCAALNYNYNEIVACSTAITMKYFISTLFVIINMIIFV